MTWTALSKASGGKKMLRSEICERLGIRYPIFQGGMAWIADGRLAAAVSEGGGLGIIAAGNAPAAYVQEQLRLARSLTQKPIGVNIMLLSPYADEVAQVVAEERAQVVTTGAGNPAKYMESWKQAGIQVVPVVASVAMAKRMSRLGAAALIAEGGESGGHVGELTTMALVPQVRDATTLPVIAAGGIADGRGMAAALMLGACGVQMGTRFLCAEECSVHPVYKEKILAAGDLCTMVTGKRLGHPVRSLRTPFARSYMQAEYGGMPDQELEALMRAGASSLPPDDGLVEEITPWRRAMKRAPGPCAWLPRRETVKKAASWRDRLPPW